LVWKHAQVRGLWKHRVEMVRFQLGACPDDNDDTSRWLDVITFHMYGHHSHIVCNLKSHMTSEIAKTIFHSSVKVLLREENNQ